jgi:hypothetical protein
MTRRPQIIRILYILLGVFMFYRMVEAGGWGGLGFFGCGFLLTVCKIERSYKGNKAVRLQKSNSALTCRQRIYGARVSKRLSKKSRNRFRLVGLYEKYCRVVRQSGNRFMGS